MEHVEYFAESLELENVSLFIKSANKKIKKVYKTKLFSPRTLIVKKTKKYYANVKDTCID